MAEIVRMPKLSDTMEEGVVAEWHKKVGDSVKSGDVLAEIETDKATMEFESFTDGVLLHIGVEKGKTAAVDSVLAVLGKEGEDVTELLAEAVAPAEKQEVKKAEPAPVPTAEPAEKAAPVAAKKAAPAASKPRSIPAASNNGRVKASPLAKRLAEEQGIELSWIKGSGTDGRIVRADVENFSGAVGSAAQVESYHEVEVSQMRKTIARRLAESKFTAPHFYLTIEVDMSRAIEVRKAINKSIEPDKVSFNDMVIKAAATALKKHPAVNSSWLEDRIRYNDHVHIGVAVAVEDGLLVPVVRFADGKRLRQIGAEVKDFAGRARAKKLQPEDWEGNTFTISNLGMFGIDEFTAIINPPDACILAIGGIQEKPVVKNGQIVPGNIMKVTLSCDHRVVDGAAGSAFLQSFKANLEEPTLMLGEMAI
jgi:pyruvate dehydrogenase E2 component (dihydrolipoamide acetyltransferase)